MWIYSITVFYNTLKLNHIILYHIWYLQHDKLPFYIYSRILPVLISSCCIEFNHYKTWIYSITVFYNTLMHNRIILYHIWYLLHDEPTVLYISTVYDPRVQFISLEYRLCPEGFVYVPHHSLCLYSAVYVPRVQFMSLEYNLCP